MDDLSEQAIRKNCPHCDSSSQAFRYPLEKLDDFFIVVDSHPIVEGHILIIPKLHISCIGEYPQSLYEKFLNLNSRINQFLKKEYGRVSSFEHGIFGQTVFHSHIHYLPFNGSPDQIIPEGKEKLNKINDLSELKLLVKKDGGYLFFSIGEDLWSVDKSLAAPRFFRDRFAKALGRSERGNWKKMHVDALLSQAAEKDALQTKAKWEAFFKT